MSGHSKWATIKRKKEASDASRGRLFTKLARQIAVAAREGGGDPDANVALRFVIDKAREQNMPNANIERAVARGSGKTGEAELESFTYDAIGTDGTAFIIEGVTDNKNRTLPELKQFMSKHNAKLTQTGSQQWQFTRVGMFAVPRNDSQSSQAQSQIEEIELTAIEAGAEDTQVTDESVEIITKPTAVAATRASVEGAGYTPGPPSLHFVPNAPLELSSNHPMRELALELLEHDDVQSVFVNFV